MTTALNINTAHPASVAASHREALLHEAIGICIKVVEEVKAVPAAERTRPQIRAARAAADAYRVLVSAGKGRLRREDAQRILEMAQTSRQSCRHKLRNRVLDSLIHTFTMLDAAHKTDAQ